jgi:hypothetical protein
MRILTIVAISVVFGLAIMQYAHGQTESRFANCIMIIDKTLQVLLSMDEDCDEQQFSDAVSYYKANGFPHEGAYYNLFETKSMQLLTDYGHSLEGEMSK